MLKSITTSFYTPCISHLNKWGSLLNAVKRHMLIEKSNNNDNKKRLRNKVVAMK